jgi:hypothetical protein
MADACVASVLLGCRIDSGDIDEQQARDLLAALAGDAFWDAVGPIADDLAAGEFSSVEDTSRSDNGGT